MREQKDIVVSSSSLSSGNTKSCGCLKKQPDKDLTNQEFGRLTVIGFAYIKNETSLPIEQFIFQDVNVVVYDFFFGA